MSLSRSVLRPVVRSVVRPVLGTRLKPPAQRRAIDTLTALAVLPKGTVHRSERLGGVPGEVVTTPASSRTRVLLYLHGGGYTVGSPQTHRAAVAHLAHAAGATAHLLDYRLAPEHPYPAAVDDALAAYRSLLDAGTLAGSIVVAGDSAGGGLSLALSLRLQQEGLPQPAALGLISPWVDLRLTGLLELDDPLLTRGWLTRCASDYTGGDNALLDLPEVSPLLADADALAGLPPLFVHGASDEILLADIERFVDAARAARPTPADVRYRRLEGHWHVTHLYAGLMSEATAVVAEMGGWLGEALDG